MKQESHLKTKALVIKSIKYGETDRILSVITDTCGKMTLLAKSAGKPGNKLSASSQFLCYSEFVIFKGRKYSVIDSGEVLEHFAGIAGDIDRLMCASHCAELAWDIVVENQPSENILRLLLNTLYLLSENRKPPELLARIFEIRLLSEAGFPPHTENYCVSCGDGLTGIYIFAPHEGGLMCERCACRIPLKINILPGTVKALFHISNSRLESVFSFDVSDEILKQLGAVNRAYISAQLGKEYTKFNST